MKGLVHKQELELYKTGLRICFDKETMEKHCDDDLSGCDGYTWWPHQGEVLWIYLPKIKGCIDVASTAHECFHVADFIFERAGMVIQEGTGNEHMAYLIGHLVNKVFDALDFDNKLEFGE